MSACRCVGMSGGACGGRNKVPSSLVQELVRCLTEVQEPSSQTPREALGGSAGLLLFYCDEDVIVGAFLELPTRVCPGSPQPFKRHLDAFPGSAPTLDSTLSSASPHKEIANQQDVRDTDQPQAKWGFQSPNFP